MWERRLTYPLADVRLDALHPAVQSEDLCLADSNETRRESESEGVSCRAYV